MSTSAPMGTGAIAAAIAKKVIDRLEGIEGIVRRQLELAEGDPRNYLAEGSVSGGGLTTGVAQGLAGPRINRRGFSLQNIGGSSGNISIGLGQTSPLVNTGLTLLPGAAWDGLVSGLVWPGRIHIIGSVIGIQYTWVEVTGPNRRVGPV